MLSLGLAVTSSLSSVEGLVRGPYIEGGLFPRLALDFDDNKYATDVGPVLFADAFTAASPKLTYSTTSNSTMVNSSGNIVWAPHNLVEDSEDFSQSWLTSSSTLTSVSDVEAPDGSSNVFELSHTANGSHIRLNTNVTTGVRYTYGIFMKYVDHQWVAIAHNNSSSPYHTWFDIQNGVKGSNAGADTSITPAGNGWYLLQAPQIANDTTSYFQVHLSVGDGSNTESVGTSAYVFGAHIYRSDLGGMGQVPGAATGFEYYVPTSGSAKRLPRVGHHVYSGSAWVNEGLLIESEARTNLVTYSEDFSQWTASSGTTVTAGATSPTGQTDAYQITLAGNNDNVQLTTAGLSTSTAVQYSVYLRVSSGTQSVNLGNIDAGQYQSVTVTTEWQRFVITQTPSATTRFPRILNGTNDSFTVEAFGAQIEQNATASSYIPTSGASATRAAQTLVVPPAAFGWNSSAVSIQMDGRITYANEGAYETAIGAKWRLDFQNEILIMNLSTNSSDVGRPFFSQEAAGTTDNVSTSNSPYSPGVLVPFNIASRHGSTFINGAVDGVALTANTTPTALPDLSGANLEIAHDFMGTIRTFRQFAGDIGDAGLVTATS